MHNDCAQEQPAMLHMHLQWPILEILYLKGQFFIFIKK